MATRRQEERGRIGGNHQGGCFTFPVGRSQSWEVTGVNAASAGNSLLMLTSAIKHHLKSLFYCCKMMGTGGVVSLPDEESAQTQERLRPYNVVSAYYT